MKQRSSGIDAARGLAVAAMVFVNWHVVLTDGQPSAWGWFGTVFQGRASALFVILAGVGIGLMERSIQAGRDVIDGDPDGSGERTLRDRLLKRGLVLALGGYALMTLWPADILHFYGVWFMLAALLVGRSSAVRATLAAAFVLAFPTLLVLGVDWELHWNFITLSYTEPWSADGLVRGLLFNGYHPTIPWFGFLCLGWAMTPTLLGPSTRLWGIAAAGAAVAALTELTSNMIAEAAGPASDVAAIFGTESMPPGPLYMLSASGTALAVLCAAIAACRSAGFADSLMVAPFVSAGRAALTLYVIHVVIGIVPMVVIYGEHQLPAAATFGATLAWLVVSFTATHLWIRTGRPGPLEAMFRSLSR